MSKEPSAEVLSKLQQATAAHRGAQATRPVTAPPVRVPKQPTIIAGSATSQAPAGNATATYLLVDHYFGGSAGTFWGYDGTQWYGASTSEPADEQGIAQVAFASNRVDIDWDDSNTLTVVRCWKYL